MEQNETNTLLGKVRHIGDQLAELGDKAARLKTEASQAAEDAVTEAKRFAKRSHSAAEDFMEDAANQIKHDPLRSVGLGIAIGLGIGALVVWLATTHKE